MDKSRLPASESDVKLKIRARYKVSSCSVCITDGFFFSIPRNHQKINGSALSDAEVIQSLTSIVLSLDFFAVHLHRFRSSGRVTGEASTKR